MGMPAVAAEEKSMMSVRHGDSHPLQSGAGNDERPLSEEHHDRHRTEAAPLRRHPHHHRYEAHRYGCYSSGCDGYKSLSLSLHREEDDHAC